MTLDLQPLLQQLPDLVDQYLQDYRHPSSRPLEVQRKADKSLVTNLDKQLQQAIEALLNDLYPDITNWGEESAVHKNTAERYWLIDPLDGTHNFVFGIPFYCSAVCLIDQQRPIAAVTYDPNRQELFSSQLNQGFFINQRPFQANHQIQQMADSLCLVNYKRLNPQVSQAIISEHPFQSQRSYGSSALEWCWLASQRVNTVIHGQQHLWDYAGGLLAVTESNGTATDLQGKELLPLQGSPQSILACSSQALHQQWHQWLDHRNLISG